MGVIWAAVLVIAFGSSLSRAAPAVRYDQRQEGDVNVRADLENFVVLIIPTSGSSSAGAGPTPGGQPSSMGLFDMLSKAVPAKGHQKHHYKHHHDGKKAHQPTSTIDTAHFIESKTAPYHVDISRSRQHLSKLRPATSSSAEQREILIAESPAVALGRPSQDVHLTKNPSYEARKSKTVSIEVPSASQVEATEDKEKMIPVKTIMVTPEDIAAIGRVKVLQMKTNIKPEDVKPVVDGPAEIQETLMLIGEPLEQCGPGSRRDSNGICEVIKSAS